MISISSDSFMAQAGPTQRSSCFTATSAEQLSGLASNPPSSCVQRRKTSFRDVQSHNRVCGAGNWERKPVPKPPCTGAQLPKRGKIKVIPEKDSREMLVQTLSCAGVPSFQEPLLSKGAQAGRGHFLATQHILP